jgi:prophage antirepressor-like protein
MKELIKFAFEGKNVRITDRNGDPWFVARDVCDILGIQEPANVMRHFPVNEKGLYNIQTLGGVQKTLCINEPGLYRLIFKSRKTDAEAFKTWIFTEVLPSIRKGGMYAVHPALAVPMNFDTARKVMGIAYDAERVFNEERETQLKIFFDVWIMFTGDRADYLLFGFIDTLTKQSFDFPESVADRIIALSKAQGEAVRNDVVLIMREGIGRVIAGAKDQVIAELNVLKSKYQNDSRNDDKFDELKQAIEEARNE